MKWKHKNRRRVFKICFGCYSVPCNRSRSILSWDRLEIFLDLIRFCRSMKFTVCLPYDPWMRFFQISAKSRPCIDVMTSIRTGSYPSWMKSFENSTPSISPNQKVSFMGTSAIRRIRYLHTKSSAPAFPASHFQSRGHSTA